MIDKVSIDLDLDIDNSFQQVIFEIEELKVVAEHVELKIVVLEVAKEKKHVEKCKYAHS